MTRTLFLHVGLGRCGSSAVQHFSALHRDALRERGLEYPSPLDMGFTEDEARGGNGRALAVVADVERAVTLVADHLAAHGGERFLLSAEQLHSSGHERLRSLVAALGARDIRVVCLFYVREQREWLVSKWAQSLKRPGFATPLDEYIARQAVEGWPRGQLRYDLRCQRLAGIFGRENLVVRRFARGALLDDDVRVDALAITGVDVRDIAAADPRPANPSATAPAAVAARVVNALPANDLLHPRALLEWAEALGHGDGGPPLYRLCPPEAMRAVAEHYEPFNEAFRREYLPDVPAPVFTSSVPDDYETISEDDLLDTATIRLLATVASHRGKRLLAQVSRACA